MNIAYIFIFSFLVFEKKIIDHLTDTVTKARECLFMDRADRVMKFGTSSTVFMTT